MRFDISKYSFIGILILLLMSCKDENNQIDEVLYIKTYLSLPSSTLDASEGSFYINVESNSDWKIVLQEGADWLNTDILSGSGNANIKFSYLSNNSKTKRYGVFKVISHAGYEIFSIKQNGKETLPPPIRKTELFPVENSLKMISPIVGSGTVPQGVTALLPDPNHTNNPKGDPPYLPCRIGGTDLGIMWDMDNGKTGFFIGDTFQANWSFDPATGNQKGTYWGPNYLGFTTNTDLDERSLVIDSWVINNPTQYWPKKLITAEDPTLHHEIVTSAIRINGVDYAHFMNIQSFGNPWIIKYSGLAKSTDDGQNWVVLNDLRFPGSSKFSLAGYCHDPNGEYVYMFGTPAGRSGSCCLARFKKEDIEDFSKYEYLDADKEWRKGNESVASPVFDAPVGEMSVFYFSHFNKYVVLYLDETQGIVMRHADNPEGPWSDKRLILLTKPNGTPGGPYGGGYGSFIHPQKTGGTRIYFTHSIWRFYSIYLMCVDLKEVDVEQEE